MNRRIEEEMNRGPDEDWCEEDLFIRQLYEKLPSSFNSFATEGHESSCMSIFTYGLKEL